MKRARGDGPPGALGEEREVSPLEERILRMHLGVPTPRREALEDGSRGRQDLGDSLSRIEADVMRRAQQPPAPQASQPPQTPQPSGGGRARLRLVKPDEG